MTSRRARLVQMLVKVRDGRAYAESWVAAGDDREKLGELVVKRRQLDSLTPPKLLHRTWAAASEPAGKGTLHVLRRPAHDAQRVLLYLHAGMYVVGPSSIEWLVMARFASRLDADLAVLNYPKVPEYTAEDTLPSAVAAWKSLSTQYPPEAIALLGASSGGGLAASLLMQLRDAGLAQPTSATLISPWLDLTMDNPEAAAMVDGDYMLTPIGLRRDAELYAAGRDLKDPLLSPIFGDLSGLPPVQVHAGVDEILRPECTEFVDKVNAAGGTGHLVLDPVGQHCGVLLPGPESAKLKDKMLIFVGKHLPE